MKHVVTIIMHTDGTANGNQVADAITTVMTAAGLRLTAMIGLQCFQVEAAASNDSKTKRHYSKHNQ